ARGAPISSRRHRWCSRPRHCRRLPVRVLLAVPGRARAVPGVVRLPAARSRRVLTISGPVLAAAGSGRSVLPDAGITAQRCAEVETAPTERIQDHPMTENPYVQPERVS